jgi:protein-S-isoprenylcysteine O-methyltransferase Ste14
LHHAECPHTNDRRFFVMNIEYPILATVFVCCLLIRAGYEILKEAHKINPESKPIFAVILTVMLTLWLTWFALCASEPHQSELPLLIRWFGLAVFISGLILSVGALIQLRGVENIDHLVTTGLFKKIRHPMYLGFLGWLLGWSLFHSATVSLGVGVPGIAGVLWWRHLEEARLRLQFGTAYEQYRETTWF